MRSVGGWGFVLKQRRVRLACVVVAAAWTTGIAMPAGATTSTVRERGAAWLLRANAALGGVTALTNDGNGYCAILTSKEVVCWGLGSIHSSDAPLYVPNTTGTGRLDGVKSVVSDAQGYCALTTQSEAECWAQGVKPKFVPATGGHGRLSGIKSIVSDEDGNYCALLSTRTAACWGQENYGEFGNGTAVATQRVPTLVRGASRVSA